MIRWFADLPIERKLRVGILVPALAVFAIGMAMHIATNVLRLREDLQQRAALLTRVTGVGVFELLQAGNPQDASTMLAVLKEDPLVARAELLTPQGTRLASFDRSDDVAFVEPTSAPPIVRAVPVEGVRALDQVFRCGDFHAPAEPARPAEADEEARRGRERISRVADDVGLARTVG